MSIISLLLPTRKRPLLVERFFQSVMAQTAKLEEVEVILYVDEDDIASHALDCKGIRTVKIVGPRLSMGGYNTACFYHASGEVVVLMNDDVVVQTPGWDVKILEFAKRIPDGIFLAYGDDLHMGRRMCTFPILSRRACEVMIKPFPEEYPGGFIDWHLLDIFKRLKRMGQDRIFYFDWLVFEHLHMDTGKGKMDATYQDAGRYEGDWPFVSLRNLRQASAKRLHAAIMGMPLPEWPQGSPRLGRPSSSVGVVLQYASNFLLDSALPISERLHLFAWMTARYLRSKGYLPHRYV